MSFDKLDPLLQTPLRLAIMSILVSVESADFLYLKKKTEATSGNLSVQISKLEEAGYIRVIKSFRKKKPHTNCKITKKGAKAFIRYFENLKSYLPNTSPETSSSDSPINLKMLIELMGFKLE